MKPFSILLLLTSFIFGVWGIWTLIKPNIQRVYKHGDKKTQKMVFQSFLLITFGAFIGSLAIVMESGDVDTLLEWIWTSIGLFCCWALLGIIIGFIAYINLKNHPFYYLDRNMPQKKNPKKEEK